MARLMILNNKKIFITGATGSFGSHFINTIVKKYKKIKKLIIFSRDELKQYELKKKFPHDRYPFMRFFLGDIRDKERLNSALIDTDIVVHAAALKQVPAAEYNPSEFIKTNIIGSQNLIDCCLNNKVQKVIALSTDKAAAPINLYGATKLCSDKLFIAANNIKGKKNISFSIIRYGNVMGSRGSVIPFFLQNKDKILTITDEKMTRFNISLDEGVNLVLWGIKNSIGQEIFVPKIPSYRITDIAKAINPNYKKKIIGIRPGEKLHEELMTESDSVNALENNKMFIILPPNIQNKKKYMNKFNARKIKKPISYNSRDNKFFLSVKDLEKKIRNLK
jgi:UDP-N-acetylglucosamine 4,6-dehydratase